MKARRIVMIILSLAYLVFLALCAYSPALQAASAFLPFAGTAAQGTGQTQQAEQQGQTNESASELKLPFVTPKVTFASGSFPEDSTSLKTVLTAGETAQLSQFTQLKAADFSGSACVEEIAAWAAQHPEVDVTYTVTLPNGTTVDNKTSALDLSGLDAAGAASASSLLASLPAVKTVDLGTVGAGGFTQADVNALRAAYPGVKFRYDFMLLGQKLGADTESVNLSAASADEINTAIQLLPSLPNLRTIVLGSVDTSAVTWDQIAAIGSACPNAVLDYGFTIWGVSANMADPMLNLSHVKMNDEGASVRSILPYMRNCIGVDMDSCGVSNDAMKQIQRENPKVSVVWRVWFGTGYSVRTDVIKILASKPSRGGAITNKDAAALACCTKVKYLDLGHNSDLSDGSFLASMPDLEVLILAHSSITDLSGLANCPHLEYLEIQHTRISDISVLSTATSLRHLNIGDSQVSDISPLFGLTELERLYICDGSLVPAAQAEQMKSIAPNCEVNTIQDKARPDEGQWRYSDQMTAEMWVKYEQNNYYAFPYDFQPRYKLLREQFGYDSGESAYAFSWNDPLY